MECKHLGTRIGMHADLKEKRTDIDSYFILYSIEAATRRPSLTNSMKSS